MITTLIALTVIVAMWLTRDSWSKDDAPAGCCGCGDDSPATVAVWGPQTASYDPEGYCAEPALAYTSRRPTRNGTAATSTTKPETVT